MKLDANLRSFNRMELNESEGLIRKYSTDNKKLLNELNWYLDLPDDIKHIAPRITRYSKIPDRVMIEMELYGYEPLNSLYLREQENGQFNEALWKKILNAMDQTLLKMSIAVAGNLNLEWDHAACLEACRQMYIDKTVERLSLIRFDDIDLENITINSMRMPSLRFVINWLYSSPLIEKFLEDGAFYSHRIIHGDFCLSNILYEPNYGFIRLIDPRGSFGNLSNKGDLRYELAKLSHSIDGNYDLYINGRFNIIKTAENEYEFITHITNYDLKSLFDAWLKEYCKEEGIELNHIRLIQSLLFLSMIPLHSDRPEAQKAMLFQGLLDFDNYLRGTR